MEDHTAAILIDQLLEKRVFHCVCCHNLLQPPVMLVEKRGNMCFSCCEEFGGKDRINAIENVALGTILEEIDYPCIYKMKGCEKRLKHKDMKEHKEKCMYQTFSCIFSPMCLWNGCVQNVIAHCREKHVDRILSDVDDCYKLQKLQDLICDGENDLDSTSANTSDSYKVRCLQDLIAQNKESKKETSAEETSSNKNDTKLKDKRDRKEVAYVLNTSRGIFIVNMKKSKTNLKVLIYDFRQVEKEKEYMFNITLAGEKGTKYSKRSRSIKDFKSFIKFDDEMVTRLDLDCISNVIFSDDENVQMIVKLINVENNVEKDEVFKQIQCAKCDSYAKSTIFRCSQGHNICSLCKPQSTVNAQCPKCSRDDLPEQFSGLEKLANLIDLPCKFKANGCMMKVRNHPFHELVCEYGTWDCFISGCRVNCSHSNLISHINKDHAIPNCFEDLPKLKINKTSQREAYHVMEHNLVFELVFDQERDSPSPMILYARRTAQVSSHKKDDIIKWGVNIIRGYAPEPYAFEVRIYLGNNHRSNQITLKGRCGYKNSMINTSVKLPFKALTGANETEFNYEVRVFKDV